MADWTGIANMTLAHLGARQINDLLTDQSESARAIRGVYLNLADEVLYAHPWKVALQRFMLSADTTGPLWGPQYAYSFPTDPWALRVWTLGSDDVAFLRGGWNYHWEAEGRKILTDFAPPLPAKFIMRVLDPNMFVGLLGTAMSRRIAQEVAFRLTNSREKEAGAGQEYAKALADARSLDSQQRGNRRAASSSILESRF
jgi:hypothetical protein